MSLLKLQRCVATLKTSWTSFLKTVVDPSSLLEDYFVKISSHDVGLVAEILKHCNQDTCLCSSSADMRQPVFCSKCLPYCCTINSLTEKYRMYDLKCKEEAFFPQNQIYYCLSGSRILVHISYIFLLS